MRGYPGSSSAAWLPGPLATPLIAAATSDMPSLESGLDMRMFVRRASMLSAPRPSRSVDLPLAFAACEAFWLGRVVVEGAGVVVV